MVALRPGDVRSPTQAIQYTATPMGTSDFWLVAAIPTANISRADFLSAIFVCIGRMQVHLAPV
jgi:hypothetical protein